ncbi:unnamed protein product [Schistocephalus solidus]|uniref:RRM domain-containing protein n=1 Tax=Schistocephalus solidus TaxID=70667 RepID=A0A183T565_SCHSO|nr:unnamed protein product [Schistocephalus solidus]
MSGSTKQIEPKIAVPKQTAMKVIANIEPKIAVPKQTAMKVIANRFTVETPTLTKMTSHPTFSRSGSTPIRSASFTPVSFPNSSFVENGPALMSKDNFHSPSIPSVSAPFAFPMDGNPTLLPGNLFSSNVASVPVSGMMEHWSTTLLAAQALSRTKKIFIGGVATSTTEEELLNYFSAFGSVSYPLHCPF